MNDEKATTITTGFGARGALSRARGEKTHPLKICRNRRKTFSFKRP